MQKSLISLVCASSVLTFALTACGTASNDAENDSSSQTFSPQEGDGADDSAGKDAPTFKDGVLTTPDLKIQVTRHKVIKAGQRGNEYGTKPVIAFYYKTTNVSGQKTDPLSFIANFIAYQDNNPDAENQLEVGSLPDDRFLESQMETIKKGGTVESAIAYELDDLKTPVDLVATDGLTDPIGKASYELE
ncbi:protein of unknown function [Nocardioides scoriae]|uniref:DUF5067 domain-containing protein n=1 Tax=Nocardioides scoriae TaxID=642780 RepID=A0A1H1VMN6_9ACTN|nr:DUF5067 domain-containing protein [Nocardioides scoriae]SDS85780.1 protein of unknown function [Nocardioides scoriae]